MAATEGVPPGQKGGKATFHSFTVSKDAQQRRGDTIMLTGIFTIDTFGDSSLTYCGVSARGFCLGGSSAFTPLTFPPWPLYRHNPTRCA